MSFTAEEQALIDLLKRHVENKTFGLNPDENTVNKLVKLLLKREIEKGAKYCPCRPVTGVQEIDANHICPCAYHEDEVKENGHCHCWLFVAKNS
jgi:ferredoxin-thioredoxin reductase catalytic chain